MPVHITDTLPAGVAFMPKGRWPKLERDGANVNALTLARPSDMGASTTVHGLEVSVTPVRQPAPGVNVLVLQHIACEPPGASRGGYANSWSGLG